MGVLNSFGKVTVSSAGTPVQASVNGAGVGTFTECNAVLIEAWPTNIGAIYIGNSSTMNKTTGAGIVAILAAPSSTFIPSFSATIAYASGGIDVDNFWIDAASNGDAVVVSSVAT